MLKQYAVREGTNRLHAGEIQHAYGYRDFADPAVQQDLVGWLEARARLASERPSVLFDLATARLLEGRGTTERRLATPIGPVGETDKPSSSR